MKLGALVTVVWLGIGGCKAAPKVGPPPALASDQDRTSYAVGLVAARDVDLFHMNDRELQIALRGFDDAMAGKDPVVDLEAFGPRIEALEKARKAADAAPARNRVLAQAAQQPNAVRSATGFVLETLRPGRGPSPTPTDVVRVLSFGMLPDGLLFEGSPLDKTPKLISLSSATECWRQALPNMKTGQKVKLTCPPGLAYGDSGRPPNVPGGAVVVFEIELVDALKAGAIAAAGPTRPEGQ